MTCCMEWRSDRFLNSFATCARRLLSIPVRSDGLIRGGTENKPFLSSSPCSQSISSLITALNLFSSGCAMDTFLLSTRNCANASDFFIMAPFGNEIGVLSRELKEAEGRFEYQQLQLASNQQQLQKISGQYRELKEQMQATSPFSRLTSLRDSLPTISFAGTSGSSAARSGQREQERRLQVNSRAEQTRLQELVEKL